MTSPMIMQSLIQSDVSASAPAAPSARVRVCHVSMHLATGGLERLLVDMAAFHDSNKFELQFVALDSLGRPAEEIRALNCLVHSLRFGQVGKRQVLNDLVELLKREEIDIVHTHNTFAHYYGARAAKRAGVPVVVNTQHGRGCGRGWKARLQFLLANRWTHRIVGVSDDATTLCRSQDPFARSRTMRIWNGIDLKRFCYHGPQPAPLAISVARLSPEKDIATLLEAVAIAVREVPEFRLHLVGDGRERAALEEQARRLGIESHVQFLGERSDVHELLRQAGFFVSSSRTEGISLTLLEAMAVGLPVLATRVGGNPEVVVDGVTGRLVPPQDPPALAQAIIRMCPPAHSSSPIAAGLAATHSEARTSQHQLESMGRLGRQRVEQHFDIHNMVAHYETLYRELMTENASPGSAASRRRAR